jgi:hypothetical protein
MVFMACLPDRNRSGSRHGQHRHSPREHFRGNVCVAALRAFTGAELHRDDELDLTLREAAMRCGSNIRYVRAAIILLEHGDQNLIDQVLHGERNILAAAASVAVVVKLVTAFKAATSENLASFSAITGMADLSTSAKRTAAASKIGPAVVWDDMISPLLS